MAIVSTDININNNDLTNGAGYFTQGSNPEVKPHNGKTNAFLVAGTFDGASISLQHKIGEVWVDVGENTTLTDDGGGLFTTPVSNIRVSVQGAGPSIDVQVIIKPIVL